MPDAPAIDRWNPSFYRFPIQSMRTGFQPVSLPLILVVPGRLTSSGQPIANSDVRDVKFYVANAPKSALVAGIEHKGMRVPDTALFTVVLIEQQLAEVMIDPVGRTFYASLTSETPITDRTIQEGDYFQYSTLIGNIDYRIPYFPDAYYYDVSNFTIDVEDLPRPESYLFIWECTYFARIPLTDPMAQTVQNRMCLSDDLRITRYTQMIQHPGDVHNDMFRKTPPLYFQSVESLKNDQLLKLYRPLADILQDVADEQSLLYGINFIDRIPVQLIPYLAFLIGWDLPNFPATTLDTIRRSILRYAVYLQKLKGTRRAITELFEIFGYTIDLINLWYSTDGSQFIAPGEKLPPKIANEEITAQTVCQIEPLIANYGTNGFGQLEIPLVYRATTNITLSAWLIKEGTASMTTLNTEVDAISNNPDALLGMCGRTSDGLFPKALTDAVPPTSSDVLSYSEIVLDVFTGQVIHTLHNGTPLLNTNISYDKLKNLINLNFDHYLNFEDGSKLFIFGTYGRTKLIINPKLDNLWSNRFDIRIYLNNNQVIQADLLDFLMNFLFKLKAFHSLLRMVQFNVLLSDLYNVQDYCSNQFGILQTIPISNDPTTCVVPPNNLTNDMRKLIYNLLMEEHANWKNLDGTHIVPTSQSANVPINWPDGLVCQFNRYGQDRVLSDNVDHDQNPDTRQKYCTLLPEIPEYCYKGRVKDENDNQTSLESSELVRCHPCWLSFGNGFYWTYPPNGLPANQDESFLGKKIRQYNRPPSENLHFTNRPELDYDELHAYQRPSLDIMKDNLGFPGHRFVTMNKLEDDFTSNWNEKPWDFGMAAYLTTGSNGDEYLVYDSKSLVYSGNGLTPDISSYGTHADRSFQITHKIYFATSSGHPAIALDDSTVEIPDDEKLIFDSSLPFGPLFSSYNPFCKKDYKSGYPAVYGRFDFDSTFYDFNRGGTLTEYLFLDMPYPSSITEDALFTYGSEILLDKTDYQWQFYKPYRYDCECVLADCTSGSTGNTEIGSSIGEVSGASAVDDGTDGRGGGEAPREISVPRTHYHYGVTGSTIFDNLLNVDPCLLSRYMQPDGTYDFNCDQLSTELKMILTEYFGVCDKIFDGEITNMLSVFSASSGSEMIPIIGSIRYKDDYNTIYESNWVVQNGVIDIYLTTKIPYVWGEPEQKYYDGIKLFVRGVITATRMKIRIATSEILFQQSEQFIDFFQLNTVCGDQQFVDNFIYHYDCAVNGNVEFEITCGPRWSKVGDTNIIWPELDVSTVDITAHPEPFWWVDVWSSDDLIPELSGKCEL